MSEQVPVPDPTYEPIFSYRVHFGRLKKLEGGGGVVFGEEARLSSQTLEDAKREFKKWKEGYRDEIEKEIIQNATLMEIRYIRKDPA